MYRCVKTTDGLLQLGEASLNTQTPDKRKKSILIKHTESPSNESLHLDRASFDTHTLKKTIIYVFTLTRYREGHMSQVHKVQAGNTT